MSERIGLFPSFGMAPRLLLLGAGAEAFRGGDCEFGFTGEDAAGPARHTVGFQQETVVFRDIEMWA